MNLLFLDTCFNKSYIVLNKNGAVCSKIIENTGTNYHSAFIIPELRNIFRENNITAPDLDAIGVNIGPGSFTGIRAGVTIARVLAQQFNTKLISVHSLCILSYLNEKKTHTAVILDARKNKVYFGGYENGLELTAPCLKDKDEITEELKNSDIIADASISEFLSGKGISCINYENSSADLGLSGMEIMLGRLKNEKDNPFNWAEARPLYIQKPSVTMPKEKK